MAETMSEYRDRKKIILNIMIGGTQTALKHNDILIYANEADQVTDNTRKFSSKFAEHQLRKYNISKVLDNYGTSEYPHRCLSRLRNTRREVKRGNHNI